MDILSSYSTPTQKIGKGKLIGSYVETNVSTAAKWTVDDWALQTYLVGLVKKGVVVPNANSYYPVHFPPGVTVTQTGWVSCVDFCGYHGTVDISKLKIPNTPYLYYGVIPDQSRDCYSECGGSKSVLYNLQTISSHELAESVANPAVGVVTKLKAPMSWYSTSQGEIGDICDLQEAKATNASGYTFMVQKVWSNSFGCIAQQFYFNFKEHFHVNFHKNEQHFNNFKEHFHIDFHKNEYARIVKTAARLKLIGTVAPAQPLQTAPLPLPRPKTQRRSLSSSLMSLLLPSNAKLKRQPAIPASPRRILARTPPQHRIIEEEEEDEDDFSFDDDALSDDAPAFFAQNPLWEDNDLLLQQHQLQQQRTAPALPASAPTVKIIISDDSSDADPVDPSHDVSSANSDILYHDDEDTEDVLVRRKTKSLVARISTMFESFFLPAADPDIITPPASSIQPTNTIHASAAATRSSSIGPATPIPSAFYRNGIHVTVSDPKFDAEKGCILYTVTVTLLRINIPNIGNDETVSIVLEKRYSEFRRLFLALRRNYSTQIPSWPDFPPKSYFKRFHASTISHRVSAFASLSTFVILHPVLYNCPLFCAFLELGAGR
ncbi:hypothetical protein HDU98_010098 [Podochytrium sp. JEL0797]|nr:hypothetical protein HDU98_010098 [Podochytrium sp. JEL0797]